MSQTFNYPFNFVSNSSNIIGNGINSFFNNNTLGNLYTTGGNVGINTTSPAFTLDINGITRITSSLTTGSIYSTNLTTTNIVGTFITTANLISTNITTTNLVSTNTSLGNLTSLTGTFSNKVGTNQTVGTILVTSTGSLIGNSNTIGNIFTTGGNVGVGTTLPTSKLHLANNSTTNNILFEAGSTSDGANLGFSTINFNGYFNTGEVRINTNKNRWRMLVDQRTTSDVLYFDTYNGTTLSTIMSMTTSGNVGINTITPQFTLDVSGTLKTTSQTGLKTTFSGVANYSIPIDLTSYQMVEIILHQNYTVNNQNCSIQYNGTNNWVEYGAVFVKNGSLGTPVTDNTNILFQTVESNTNDSFAVIKIGKTSITGGRNIIDIRGSYCWAAVGQTRVDATGTTVNIPTSIFISVPSGTISGSYTIRNIV